MKSLFIAFIFTLSYERPVIFNITKCNYNSALGVERFFSGKLTEFSKSQKVDLGSFIFQQPVSNLEYQKYCHTVQYKAHWAQNLSDWVELDGMPKYLVLPTIESMVCYR